MKEIKLCGNCKFSSYSKEDREFCCCCEESDNYGLPTFYDEVCDEWKGKTNNERC